MQKQKQEYNHLERFSQNEYKLHLKNMLAKKKNKVNIRNLIINVLDFSLS